MGNCNHYEGVECRVCSEQLQRIQVLLKLIDDAQDHICSGGTTDDEHMALMQRMNEVLNSPKPKQLPLPLSNWFFTCPVCGSHHFGTDSRSEDKSEWVVTCHGPGCAWRGPYLGNIRGQDG